MGTAATISFEKKDKTIRTIYVHWDGYPKGVGAILFKHYDETNLDKLMDLGDLSVLGTTPVSDPNGWDYRVEVPEHLCVAYKDRGEDSPAYTYKSMDAFRHAHNSLEYNYLYSEGKWYVWSGQLGNRTPKPLEDFLTKAERGGR